MERREQLIRELKEMEEEEIDGYAAVVQLRLDMVLISVKRKMVRAFREYNELIKTIPFDTRAELNNVYKIDEYQLAWKTDRRFLSIDGQLDILCQTTAACEWIRAKREQQNILVLLNFTCPRELLSYLRLFTPNLFDKLPRG